jgi:hypothetical protein
VGGLTVHPDFGPLYAGPCTLHDGRIAYVMSLTYGRARLNIGDEFLVHDGY